MVTGAPKDLCRLALAGGALLVLACGHTEPFSTPPYGTTQPFDPTPPVRLTLNDGPDRDPSWLPDGSGILYQAQQLSRHDFDVCLSELPPDGGTQRRLVCDLAAGDDNLTNAFGSPVAGPDGRLAFLRIRGTIQFSDNPTTPNDEVLSVASGLDAANAVSVQRLPYQLPGERPHNALSQLQWLGRDSLIYLAQATTARRPCDSCTVDTMVTGLALVSVGLSPAGPPTVIPTAGFASGVAVGASPDDIYFTLNGDSRVYRRNRASGDQTVAFDFGPAGIARDVHVAGQRMTAVVGGRVHVLPDPTFGEVQRDSGGVVHVVDLASGDDVVLQDDLLLFRHPVLSPTGDRVVAEGYPVTSTPFGTTVSRKSDLYLFAAP
jgi:hypothetical protein